MGSVHKYVKYAKKSVQHQWRVCSIIGERANEDVRGVSLPLTVPIVDLPPTLPYPIALK